MTALKAGFIVITDRPGNGRRVLVRGGFADINQTGLTVLAERALPEEEITQEILDHEILLAEMAHDATSDGAAKQAAWDRRRAAPRGQGSPELLRDRRKGERRPASERSRKGARFALPPQAARGEPRALRRELAQDVVQDAAVAEVFELVERIDAADHRNALHRAVRRR